jgi:membrane protein YdbS with pleckstrin-like domain
MSELGGTTALLRAPHNQVSPRAVPYWTLSALIGDTVLWLAALAAWAVFPDRPGWTTWLLPVLAVAAVAHVLVMPRIRYDVHRWEVTPIAVHTRSGWIGRQTRIAPISRVQTVDSRQGALMRAFGLASLTVTTASAAGPISIACLDAGTARELVARLTAITATSEGDAT